MRRAEGYNCFDMDDAVAFSPGFERAGEWNASVPVSM